MAAPERHPTAHRQPGRRGHRPLAVVLHTTAGTYQSAVWWFADPVSGVSSHYLVGLDGRLGQFVDEADTARHAGRVDAPSVTLPSEASPNLWTIGIEFEDGGDPLGVERPDAQYDAGAALVAAVAGRWGIPLDRHHVLGHREINSEKDCPGNLDLGRLVATAALLAP